MTWDDDIPTLQTSAMMTLDGLETEPDVLATLEAEMDRMPHLDGDIRYETRATKRSFINAIAIETAAAHLQRLPEADEAFHLVTSGRYALWDVVPAALELAAPATIAELYIATLGFSRKNVAAMCDLLDAGKIGRLTLLCSHYFKGTSGGIYEFAAEELARRGQRFASLRTHAKLLAMKLSDGRNAVVEASANLRSCKNIEQLTVIGHPGLYAFHAGWIESLVCN